uniref:Uncharacterized protein n=1 Tax=Arundo donax TaxID=35708 RepID=A0A0A9B1T4_ARUDO
MEATGQGKLRPWFYGPYKIVAEISIQSHFAWSYRWALAYTTCTTLGS